MPTQDDIDRLKRLAGEEPFSDEERQTLSRDSKVHVSVHLNHHGRASSGAPGKKPSHLKAVAESPWAKAALVVVLGGAGSEGHRLFAAQFGLVQRSELEAHKKTVTDEAEATRQKLRAVKTYATETRELCTESQRSLYGMGRYLYYVLPKTGVLVTLEQGVQPPPVLEFHPAPLSTKGGAKPIQPKETFPMPEKP